MERLLTQSRKATIFIISLIIFSVVIAVILVNRRGLTNLSDRELKSLKFVQVIFRHGERTLLEYCTYPKDPYLNYTFPPYGIGTLTNNGKRQMYYVGKGLRQRYDKFLGDYYLPNLIETRTSDLPRTHLSLQLVLAGLFPPKGEQIWETGINWQPIPYKVTPKQYDKLFSSFFCPGYKKLYREFIKTEKIQLQYLKNKEIFDYVSLHTGLNITTAGGIILIYDNLKTKERFGLSLPKWSKKVYPDRLVRCGRASFENFCGTDKLKRLFIGYLLKQLLNEINDKINARINERFSLYSCHDFNIFGINCILKLSDHLTVPFGAHILIELHKFDNNYRLKFYYHDFKEKEPVIVRLLDNKTSITIEEFSKVIEKFLPAENECEEGPNGLDQIYEF